MRQWVIRRIRRQHFQPHLIPCGLYRTFSRGYLEFTGAGLVQWISLGGASPEARLAGVGRGKSFEINRANKLRKSGNFQQFFRIFSGILLISISY
jgi:hypothetical protein